MGGVLRNRAGRSFLEVYEEQVGPVLESIDVLFKTGAFPISPAAAGRLLGISNDEVFTIMGTLNAREVDGGCFLALLSGGSGEICGMLKRELDLGSPALYGPGDVAYIYGLDEEAVAEAFRKLYITKATGRMLPEVFARVPA